MLYDSKVLSLLANSDVPLKAVLKVGLTLSLSTERRNQKESWCYWNRKPIESFYILIYKSVYTINVDLCSMWYLQVLTMNEWAPTVPFYGTQTIYLRFHHQ